RTLDRADMHECIGLAIVTRDETEALHGIEELHGAGGLFAGALALRAGRALLHRDNVAHDLEVGRGNLAAPVDQIEGQFLPFGETFEARALNLADMDEDVLAATFLLDEAEALAGVEEFHDALAGADDLGRHSAAARSAAAETA